ncbi:glycosyltransferase [Microbacterium sp.]|uniref:glycosyltransferase n=1 Tax=Microbacterium sp. TaxID=51671 RepID=UPI003567B057
MSTRSRVVGAVRAATGIVPDAVLARLMPRGLRWDQTQMRVAHAPSTPVRLLIAPTNSAGQAYRWARAVESSLSTVGAVNLMTTNARTARFSFPADVEVPDSGYLFAHGWQKRQREAIVGEFTHVLIESGRYVHGPVPWKSPTSAALDLAARGVGIGLLWHGSDIRVPSEHAAWEADSPFGPRGHYPTEATAVLEANAIDRGRMITDTDLPVFVSTPGLLSVPRARWLPVVVDPSYWRAPEPPLSAGVPVVAYVPSNSPMKGDSSIDIQLESLESEGLIRYRRLEGVPASEMPDVYRSADIVLDQFRLGDYGVAACEAMAAGRVVIGHVHDEVRARVVDLTGRDLPIVEARYDGVGEKVREILDDPEPWIALAKTGISFVDEIHDGRLSATQLSDFLGIAVDTSSSLQEGRDD